MNISEKVLIKGVDDEELENDLAECLVNFRQENEHLEIEKVSPIVKVVLESAGVEKDFELSEDANNIRLEVGNEPKRKTNERLSAAE